MTRLNGCPTFSWTTITLLALPKIVGFSPLSSPVQQSSYFYCCVPATKSIYQMHRPTIALLALPKIVHLSHSFHLPIGKTHTRISVYTATSCNLLMSTHPNHNSCKKIDFSGLQDSLICSLAHDLNADRAGKKLAMDQMEYIPMKEMSPAEL